MSKYATLEPMKYWTMPPSTPKEKREAEITWMIESGNYVYGRKYDGNWSRAIIDIDFCALQTRGISKKTSTYGEVQNKVLFWDSVENAFDDTTVLLGEIYLPGGHDKDVGSILRCLDDKALSRQTEVPLHWMIFDVLVYEGKELMDLPAVERFQYISLAVNKIKHPLVHGVKYHPMDSSFYENLAAIFSDGGEGVVAYRDTAIYVPGKRGPHAHDSLKIKQELEDELDCFILATVAPSIKYTGDYVASWQYWLNEKTGEKLFGNYASQYTSGALDVIPITKNYYLDLPAAITCGVYDNNGNIFPLCDCAGLTDDFKAALRDNFDDYYMKPIKITGMMVSADRFGKVSIRHPRFKSLRSEEDIDIVKDCVLNKII